MEQPNLLIQNQQLHLEIKRRVDQISAINMVAATVGHTLDLNITLNTALEAVTSVVGAEAAGISLIDEQAGEVVLRAQLGWLNDFVVTNPMRIPLGKGMSGQVIMNDDVVVHNFLSGNEDYAVPSFRDEHFQSIAMAPMHAHGKIIGILSLMSHRSNRFHVDIVDVLRAIADTVGVAIENARLHERHVEQENRLTAILHSTADGIIATDQMSRIQLINQAAANMLDVQADELIGIPLREVNIQIRIKEKLIQALSTDATYQQRTFQVALEGGRELSVLVSPVRISSQIAEDNIMDGWVIVLQDITHIRAAEIARVQFMQAAAHDMKNPLSVAQKSIYMLESMVDIDADESMKEVFEIARRGIDRVHRLIDDLLNIEKIESGYDFKLAEVDLREMCYEVAAEVYPLLESAHIHFEMDIEQDIPSIIEMDRQWMFRALHNYLENACKYAPNGTVQFRVFMNNANLHFEVRDNGPGVPLRAQSRLFDRFYRVENRRDVRGSGLGLAIVKSVAEAHDGTVYVYSDEGQGSTFGLSLPVSTPIYQDHAL